MERAKQLTAGSTTYVTTEEVKPVYLTFCVDVQYITLVTALKSYIRNNNIRDLDVPLLRTYLDVKETIVIDDLDDIVEKYVKWNMFNCNARSRMQLLFICYNFFVSKHGPTWIEKDNKTFAINHVLSVIRPVTLKNFGIGPIIFSSRIEEGLNQVLVKPL